MERPDRTVTAWRTSTYTGGNASNCVEAASVSGSVLVRDTKNRAAVSLTITSAAWTQFAAVLKV